MEQALIDLLGALVKAIGDLAEVFTKNQAWGVVAALLVLLVVQGFYARRDRLDARKEEQDRDAKLGGLLEVRNAQLLEAFDRATNMIQVVEGLEDRVDAMDKRCDARQRSRLPRRKDGQP